MRFTRRTRDGQLFVNPLMAMYFTFDLVGLAKQNLYLDRLDNTFGMRQVWTRIEEFREQVTCVTASDSWHRDVALGSSLLVPCQRWLALIPRDTWHRTFG